MLAVVGALLFLMAHGELCVLWLPDSAFRDWLYRLVLVQSPVLWWGRR